MLLSATRVGYFWVFPENDGQTWKSPPSIRL